MPVRAWRDAAESAMTAERSRFRLRPGAPGGSPAAGRKACPTEIAWAVTATSRFVPRATCLVRALAAQRLLARNGSTSRLHIGVAAAGGLRLRSIEAHAWLECEGEVIAGSTDAGRFTSLFTRECGAL
jgi:Transglutaminase-like superfamily